MNFQVTVTPVVLTLPLKTLWTSTVVQLILFDEIDAEDNRFIKVINNKEIVGQISSFNNHINVELALNSKLLTPGSSELLFFWHW